MSAIDRVQHTSAGLSGAIVVVSAIAAGDNASRQGGEDTGLVCANADPNDGSREPSGSKCAWGGRRGGHDGAIGTVDGGGGAVIVIRLLFRGCSENMIHCVSLYQLLIRPGRKTTGGYRE